VLLSGAAAAIGRLARSSGAARRRMIVAVVSWAVWRPLSGDRHAPHARTRTKSDIGESLRVSASRPRGNLAGLAIVVPFDAGAHPRAGVDDLAMVVAVRQALDYERTSARSGVSRRVGGADCVIVILLTVARPLVTRRIATVRPPSERCRRRGTSGRETERRRTAAE